MDKEKIIKYCAEDSGFQDITPIEERLIKFADEVRANPSHYNLGDNILSDLFADIVSGDRYISGFMSDFKNGIVFIAFSFKEGLYKKGEENG